MSKIKSIISVTLAVLFIFALVPTVAFASGNGITQKINELRTVYDTGTYFTSNGRPDDGIENSYCRLSNIPARGSLPSGSEVARALNDDSYSCRAFANYAFYYIFGTSYWNSQKVSKPSYGDYIILNNGRHSAIFLRQDNDKIWVYDGNGNISKNEVTYENWFSKSKWYISEIYHAKSYEKVANNISLTSADLTGDYYVTFDDMFLRDKPNTTGNKLFDGTIPSGTRLRVTETSGNWGKVSYGGYTGWMSLEYSLREATQEAPTSEAYITKEVLNFRAEPSISSSVYCTIPKGTSIEITVTYGSWGKTSFNGKTGWVSLDYCRKLVPHEVEWLVIDVSEHNVLSAADWQKIKAAGVKAAILRVGGRYVKSKEIYNDDLFLQHYQNAKAAGLYVGAYFFSYALTESGAIEEADTVIKILSENNCKMDMPVFIDIEDYTESDGTDRQHTQAGKAVCSKVADVFCKTIENAGYYAGIYSSKSFLEDFIEPSVLADRAVWVAHYGVEQCGYVERHDMWQYSRRDTISGVSDTLDANYCYTDFPKLINAVYDYADVDGDGKIGAADARLALRGAVGLTILTKASKTAADIDCNGKINSNDARMILRIAVGLENPQELYEQYNK